MSDTPPVIRRFLSAWSDRDPQLAGNEVTPDVTITDPYGTTEGPAGLIEHLDVILRRFDFTPASVTNCFVDGDLATDARLAFVLDCPMKGRSSRVLGLETGFEAGVFVQLRGGKIHTWTEYWDPAPMARTLAEASKQA